MQSSISRRGFVAGAAATAACAAATVGVAPASATDGTTFVRGVEWDAEYDVVVIGYGFAGGHSALAASDAGARVLILEKAALGLEGGNSRYAGQGFAVPNGDPDKTRAYFQDLRGYFSTPSDAMIDAYVEKAESGADWLRRLGVDPYTEGQVTPSAGEYRELPHGGGDDKENGPFVYLYVAPTIFDASHYNLVQQNVEAAEGIDVWYECPATHLVQDPDTKVVHGVEFEHDGKAYRVRAKRGVIMAPGGFENNPQMLQDYLLLPSTVPFGALYNTGDGVTMAQEVDANLWHMGNLAGIMWAFKSPECEHGLCPLSFAMKAPGFMMVGPSGQRFENEDQTTRHGLMNYAGTYRSQPAVVPAYGIFDSAYMAEKGRLYPQFSVDNSYEVDNGYFLVADTLEELAQKLYDDMPDFVRQPNAPEKTGTFADRFLATVDRWNADFAAGGDTLYGRGADSMYAISEPPFYAIPLHPTMFNTQGGAERDEQARVLDRDGNPIPHLYSAGEFGAMWSCNYNGGCNIGEGVMYGRIAGENAAAATEDVVDETLAAGSIDFSAASEEDPELSENQYLGCGWGIGGRLKVVCTIEGGVLTDVQVVRSMETPGIGTLATSALPAAFVEANGVDVETVSGATSTSRALIAAVTDCLTQAGIEVPESSAEADKK